jgi:TrmH family RNA methyltransferase
VISIAKLSTLPPKTRLRKAVLLLQAMELACRRGSAPGLDYTSSLAGLLQREPKLSEEARREASRLERWGPESEPPEASELLRALNGLRHALLRQLGAEPAEWDLLEPGTDSLDPAARRVLPMAVYLEDVRSPFNVGSMFRTAEALGVERILLSPQAASPLHLRAVKTARGATEAVPWEIATLGRLEGCGGVFALELGGASLAEFHFPPRGVMLVGSEELGLSPEALELARRSAGRVSIPLGGAKRSLNVAVAFGIALHAWFRSLQSGESH